MKSVVVVLAALAVCVLAVFVVHLLAPGLSWADVFEWLKSDPVFAGSTATKPLGPFSIHRSAWKRNSRNFALTEF